MALHNPILLEKYRSVSMHREIDGKKVLVNLPRREPGEIDKIKEILSSHSCRACAYCCKGFAFSKKDPNFETIMKGVKGDKKAFGIQKEKHWNGTKYVVYPHAGKNTCGFLEWDRGEIPIWAPGNEGIRKDGGPAFSCGIYSSRPSVCTTYPFVAAFLGERHEPDPEKAGMVVLAWKCKAMLELAQNGIGHLTESEILLFRGGAREGSVLSSLPDSLEKMRKNIGGNARKVHVFHNESGEEVFPLSIHTTFPVIE